MAKISALAALIAAATRVARMTPPEAGRGRWTLFDAGPGGVRG
jgi:hypothetical protein